MMDFLNAKIKFLLVRGMSFWQIKKQLKLHKIEIDKLSLLKRIKRL